MIYDDQPQMVTAVVRAMHGPLDACERTAEAHLERAFAAIDRELLMRRFIDGLIAKALTDPAENPATVKESWVEAGFIASGIVAPQNHQEPPHHGD